MKLDKEQCQSNYKFNTKIGKIMYGRILSQVSFGENGVFVTVNIAKADAFIQLTNISTEKICVGRGTTCL